MIELRVHAHRPRMGLIVVLFVKVSADRGFLMFGKKVKFALRGEGKKVMKYHDKS